MSSSIPAAVRVLLFESGSGDRLPQGRCFEIIRRLLERGYAVRRGHALEDGSASGEGPRIVLGRFSAGMPSAERFSRGGAVDFLDIADLEPAAVADLVDSALPSSGVRQPGRWKPWFPVIDYGRCTHCMQCLSFCLFDVYGVTPDARITVVNPANCKTDCPACARVCPEVAIVFPKYRAGPIHGAEVAADDVRREALKIDISSLLGGDIYAMLRDRSERAKSRFSKERDDQRALEERQRCLAKFEQQWNALDIPPEALANLPSADQIREKAAAAQRRAQAALAMKPHDPSADR
jgi:Pyruvate/2-oxoacid:ferredoxin oxidoreductase delta subunit